jgi:hypothetical protein
VQYYFTITAQLKAYLQYIFKHKREEIITGQLRKFLDDEMLRNVALDTLSDKIKLFAQPGTWTRDQEMESVLVSFFKVFTEEEIVLATIHGAKRYIKSRFPRSGDLQFLEFMKPYFSESFWENIQEALA